MDERDYYPYTDKRMPFLPIHPRMRLPLLVSLLFAALAVLAWRSGLTLFALAAAYEAWTWFIEAPGEVHW